MNRNSHPQGIFALVLCLIFAIFTMALTLTASSVYRNIAADAEQNHAARTALSYISTRIRQSDSVTAEKNCLMAISGESISRIYYHNGGLTEHYGAVDMDFEPDYGNAIISADSFAVSEENGAIRVEIGINGMIYQQIFAKNR